MSWTDTDTIKKHLLDLNRLPTDLADVRVRLDENGVAELPHRGILESGLQVKRLHALEPELESSVQLTGTSWRALLSQKLIPGEIAVAEDSSLQTLYQPEVDYVVDAAQGRIRRVTGSSIGDGQSVAVWYRRYDLLAVTTDYTVDASAGEITLQPGGALDSDTEIFVDYSISAGSAVNDLLPQALTEAEDVILALLKSEYSAESSDQGLKTGATELVLSVVCRSLAMAALLDGAPSAEGRARAWRELSDRCETAAFRTLRPFLDAPAPASGGRKTNTSWKWA